MTTSGGEPLTPSDIQSLAQVLDVYRTIGKLEAKTESNSESIKQLTESTNNKIEYLARSSTENIQELTRKTDEAAIRIPAIESKLDKHITAIESRLDKHITVIESKLDKHITDTNTEELTRKTDEAALRIPAIESTLDKRITAVENKLDKHVSDTKEDIKEQSTALNQLGQKRVAVLEARSSTIKTIVWLLLGISGTVGAGVALLISVIHFLEAHVVFKP
jgi:organic radical activating enzyme